MRGRALGNFLTPSLVVGTLLSIVSAFLLLAFDVTDFGTSFAIGLAGMTLSAAIDLIDRAEYADVFRAPTWLRSEVARVGHLSQQVLGHRVDTLDAELRAVVTRAVGDIEQLANGRMERSGSDTRHMLVLTAEARRRISGVTNVTRRGGASRVDWWSSDFGQRYWRANVEALARGVVVERVFVYEQLDDQLQAIAEEQRRAGVAVHLIDAAAVAPQYRANVVVWDDRCAWEARMDAYANITGNLYSYSPLDVRRCGDVVATLLVQAREDGSPPS
jgi:hypothetical protein